MEALIGCFRLDVTWIFKLNTKNMNRKEYFEIPWAALRSMCDPSFAKRAVFSHSEYLPRGNVITSAAANITDTEVITAKGEKVAYDFAVIATGHSETGAYTKDEKFSQYQTGNIMDQSIYL